MTRLTPHIFLTRSVEIVLFPQSGTELYIYLPCGEVQVLYYQSHLPFFCMCANNLDYKYVGLIPCHLLIQLLRMSLQDVLQIPPQQHYKGIEMSMTDFFSEIKATF